jgi:hypothetical protein
MSDAEKSQTSATVDPEQRRRLQRREAARRRLRRRRLLTGLLVALGLLAAVIALALAGGGGHGRGSPSSSTGSGRARAVVAGGPLAPASVGGLAALWAPENVVGSQPGTAAAYQAASTRSGLPGYLMIADRGNNRILVVDPSGHVVFRYPGRGEPSLFFDVHRAGRGIHHRQRGGQPGDRAGRHQEPSPERAVRPPGRSGL